MVSALISTEDCPVPDERHHDDAAIRTCVRSIRIDSHPLRFLSAPISSAPILSPEQSDVDNSTDYENSSTSFISDAEAENKPARQYSLEDSCSAPVADWTAERCATTETITQCDRPEDAKLYELVSDQDRAETVEDADLMKPIHLLMAHTHQTLCEVADADHEMTESSQVWPEPRERLAYIHTSCPKYREIESERTPADNLEHKRRENMYYPSIPPKPPNRPARGMQAPRGIPRPPIPSRFLDSYGRPLTEGFDAATTNPWCTSALLKNFNSAPSSSSDTWDKRVPRRRAAVDSSVQRRRPPPPSKVEAAQSPPADLPKSTPPTRSASCMRPPTLQCPRSARANNHSRTGVLSGRLTIYGPINLKWIEQQDLEYRDALPACSVLRKEGLELRRNWGKEALDMYRIYSNNFSR